MSEDDKTYLSGQKEAVSRPAAPQQLVPGAVLKGTYRIDSELGSGGMGTVFRATHIGLEKAMAVKVLSPRAVATPDSLARFEREAKVAGKVSHPAMTAVIDFGVEQGTPYIVMEYVQGVELAELLERQGAMTARRAVAVMRQIVSLLRAAHALGIVHRDLKPANIKIFQETSDDSQLFVKVLDFGVAKIVGDVSGQLTSEGMLVGTPAYMAPEQITGHPIDGRTDLYAAGLIFYEMLGGARAFKGETIARILHAQMHDPPPPLTTPVPEIVRQTLQKLCEKRPEDRYQDAAEADRALLACEDALRPPSGNLVKSTVLPAPGGLEATAEDRAPTLEFRPKPQEPAPLASEAHHPPGISVSDSLVREGQSVQEKLAPALVEPKPVPAPVPEVQARPVPAPAPAPVLPPLQPVAPKKSSGAGKVLVLVGAAFALLLLVVLAGGVWAWKSGRFSSLPSGSSPAETPPRIAAPTPPAPPVVAEQPPAPPVEAEQGEDEEDEQEEARAEDANEDAHEGQEAGNEAQAGQAAADSCFVSVLELESRRSSPQGKYGPWLPQPLTSRESVDCGSITPQKLPSKYRELFMGGRSPQRRRCSGRRSSSSCRPRRARPTPSGRR
jgi:serine/threonine protein kinase